MRSDQRGRFFFLSGKLGVFVELLVGAEPVLDIAIDLVVEIALRSGARRCKGENQE